MDFSLSEEQLALQDYARLFASKELPDIAKQIEKTDEPPNIKLRKQ